MRRKYLVCVAGCSLVAGAVLIGCVQAPVLPPPIPVADNLDAEYVASGIERPAALAFAPDGRVFYTEKNTGRIRVIQDDILLAEPFATVPVNFAGERGLLGIALHPDFAQNNRVYVFYSLSDSGVSTNLPQAIIDNRVVYFEAVGNVASGSEIFVASLPAGESENVGGRLAFGDDGTLFVGLGDLGDAEAAQRADALNGKVLRYNADGSIPGGNPAADSPVFARGVRQIRGISIDPVSTRPYVTDRNPTGQHEVNRVDASFNYGWPRVTGAAKTPPQLEFAQANPDYVDPIVDSQGALPNFAGGSFNPSSRYGHDARNDYFYAEASKRRIMRLSLTNSRTRAAGVTEFAKDLPGEITDVVFTPAGTIYVACESAILRLVPYPS